MRVNIFPPSGWVWFDSYGRKAIELANHMTALGYVVNRWGCEGNAPIYPVSGGIFLGYPTLYGEYKKNPLIKQGQMISVTAWESTLTPPEWTSELNKMAAISVGSHYTKTALVNSGVGAPIFVHPLGVSETFKARLKKRGQGNKIRILMFGDRGFRKGVDVGLFAFVRAFADREDVELVVKSRHPLLEKITNTNVSVAIGDYTEEEMLELYLSCDILLFPTRGEGFGLPPREFAATGGISIATDYSGTADDLEHWGVPIPVFKEEVAWKGKRDWYGALGMWASVDINTTSELLVHVVNNIDSYADFGIRAAGFVRSKYKWSVFADQVASMYEGIE